MIADIRFACAQCGQFMLADSTAAGLSASCPHCGRMLTIPDGRVEQHLVENERARSFVDSDAERAALREQLAATIAECERLGAAGTHAQVEIKSFQTERLTMKTELTQTRQRLSAAESQLAQHEEALAAAQSAGQHLEGECETLRGLLAVVKERVGATDTQLSVKEQEIAGLREQLAGHDAAAALAQAEIGALQDESAILRRGLDMAREAAASARHAESRLVQAEQELIETAKKLETAEGTCKSLTARCEELRKETETLRGDLNETESGRELVRLRATVEELEEDRHRLLVESCQLVEDMQKIEAHRASLVDLLGTTRQRLEESDKRAEASSDERLKQDNMALRGIIARQNDELAQLRLELHRLKRARLALRIVYALVTLGFVILAIVLINVIPTLL